VSWNDCIAYCEWLTEQLTNWDYIPEFMENALRRDGWRVTLPSEAEWEKAARGTDGRSFAWGEEPDPNLANTRETNIRGRSPVGAFPGGRSPYRILDLCGNTLEWTRSQYLERGGIYDPNDGREELAEDDKITRVLRGGTYFVAKNEVTCTWPIKSYPIRRIDYIGFRVVIRCP
jgi:formylglycine-generating enzyme required for sulfatase activity